MKAAKLGIQGKVPGVKIKPIDPDQPRVEKQLSEQQKYEKMWTVDEYRAVSPGELAANTFLGVAKPKKHDPVIDFGCGTGRGGFYLWAIGGMDVQLVDFAENCLDPDTRTACDKFPDRMEFIQADLNEPLNLHSKYGYCTDVMEHIPPAELDNVLANILNTSERVFFRISTTPDIMGPRYLKQPLHLSVHSYAWWAKKFLEHDAIILYSEDLGGAVDFYVTGWSSDLPKNPKINTPNERILGNIRENAKHACKHVRPHQLQPDVEVMLLAGGPSLNDYHDEILENYANGMKVVTTNGTYHWAIQRGMTRLNQCVIDARPFNRRFVEPVSEDALYFIASQCDPSVFEALPPERTFFWHCTGSPESVDVVDDCYDEYVICGGGSTVTLRAIALLRVLGFQKIHIYGMDSCVREEQHHAYHQPENDYKTPLVPVTVGDKTFQCQPWMAYQAYEFVDMVRALGDEIMLDIKGDGLIAHILRNPDDGCDSMAIME